MRLPFLHADSPFPPTSQALTAAQGANGLLAAGADLSVPRLVDAYRRGIFPWFSDGDPILWWSPSPRMVLYTDRFKVSRSFRKTIRACTSNPDWQFTMDTAFADVIQGCSAPRDGQAGTWIVPDMQAAYRQLHAAGFAHSVETWFQGELVGGLYCVAIGQMVFGESMFSRQPDASKLALFHLVEWVSFHGVKVIDCQQNTRHLASLGGCEIDRVRFEEHVTEGTAQPALPWAPGLIGLHNSENSAVRDDQAQ